MCLEYEKNIVKEGNYTKIKMRETLEIYLHPNNIDHDDGAKLNEILIPLVHKLKNS
jgi:hypothetical protein